MVLFMEECYATIREDAQSFAGSSAESRREPLRDVHRSGCERYVSARYKTSRPMTRHVDDLFVARLDRTSRVR